MRPPESWRSAPATLVIAALTVLAWAVAAGLNMSDFAAVWGGFVPDRVTGLPGDEWLAPVWLTPLTATLVHAGFLHLALNMLILLFCARAVEPILGTVGLVILYVVGAYAAAAAHFFIHVQDGSPMVGASGAISAVLGAYAMLFGRNRVRIANPRLVARRRLGCAPAAGRNHVPDDGNPDRGRRAHRRVRRRAHARQAPATVPLPQGVAHGATPGTSFPRKRETSFSSSCADAQPRGNRIPAFAGMTVQESGCRQAE